ncbi:MAG: methyltransferase domain-containing protein [Candidatus Delongbacteria bacterium]|nr:methyltransferase domain-containing protein [Candidatus Delongbacteria bacterium]MBN2834344.1 methyltransferase domain-containing protein [Candidatus Delongbacteria bacterium]
MLEDLDKRLKDINGGLVLDVATGIGDFIGFIKEFGSYDKIIAIDSMPRMEEFFKKNFVDDNSVEFSLMDAEVIDFPEEQFDTVCVSNSLHHFKNPEKVLNNMYRVLKTGGLFMINEMRSDELSKAQISHDKVHRFSAEMDRIRGNYHDDTYSRDKLLSFFNSILLDKIEFFDYFFPIDEAQSIAQVERLKDMLTKQVEQFKDHEKFDYLLEKSKAILAYLDEYGFAPASSVFLIGVKN